MMMKISADVKKDNRSDEKRGISRNKSFRRKRLKTLARGKAKHIGFFEAIPLKILGCADGARGMPQNSDGSGWNSAFMNREINAYEEFCSRIWAALQLESEDSYAGMDQLIDSIMHTQVLLEETRRNLSAAAYHEDHAQAVRQNGEDKLTDTQVETRRAKERAKRLAFFQSRIDTLERQLTSYAAEFSRLRTKLTEEDNSTKLICERVMNHTLQRLDVYWSSVLRKHPQKAELPDAPAVRLTFRSEQTYMKQHEALRNKAEKLCTQMAEYFAGKEAA